MTSNRAAAAAATSLYNTLMTIVGEEVGRINEADKNKKRKIKNRNSQHETEGDWAKIDKSDRNKDSNKGEMYLPEALLCSQQDKNSIEGALLVSEIVETAQPGGNDEDEDEEEFKFDLRDLNEKGIKLQSETRKCRIATSATEQAIVILAPWKTLLYGGESKCFDLPHSIFIPRGQFFRVEAVNSKVHIRLISSIRDGQWSQLYFEVQSKEEDIPVHLSADEAMIKITFKRYRRVYYYPEQSHAYPPKKTLEHSGGIEVYAMEGCEIEPNKTVAVPTGLAVAVNHNHWLSSITHSAMLGKKLHVYTFIIKDEHWADPVTFMIKNQSTDTTQVIRAGDPIAVFVSHGKDVPLPYIPRKLVEKV